MRALSEIGDESALPALIDFLKSPKTYELGRSAMRGGMNGITEAAGALAALGPAAEPAVQHLVALLERRNEGNLMFSAPPLLRALSKIPSKRAVPVLRSIAGQTPELFEAPIPLQRSHLNFDYVGVRFETSVEALKALEAQRDSGIDIAEAKDEAEKALSSVSSNAKGWLDRKFKVLPNSPLPRGFYDRKRLQRMFDQITGYASSILLELNPAILRASDVVAVIYKECRNDPSLVDRVLGLGPKLDLMIPELTREASILSSDITDGVTTVDGCRWQGSKVIIQILQRLATPAAEAALTKLSTTPQLKAIAGKALSNLRNRRRGA
jgi:hypothetical protein